MDRKGGTGRLTFSLLLFALTLTGCASLIEWGWDEPDQAFLSSHLPIAFLAAPPPPEPEQPYGLPPAFVDGILAGKPKEMEVVEGHEPSYPFRVCH
ncbi:MAG: hypothetical protein ACREJ6_12980 [Candidatus Methylomirabilis sp.]